MSLILLTVTKPRLLSPKVSGDWLQLVAIVKESAKDNQDIEVLSESVLSIRGKDGLYPFALVLKAAHELNFSYNVTFFDGKENWRCEEEA